MAQATRAPVRQGARTTGVTDRMILLARERGGRLLVAARDARTIAGMLDNHGRPETAAFLRRSGARGERVGSYLTEMDEADLRRAAAIAAASAMGLVVARRIRAA